MQPSVGVLVTYDPSLNHALKRHTVKLEKYFIIDMKEKNLILIYTKLLFQKRLGALMHACLRVLIVLVECMRRGLMRLVVEVQGRVLLYIKTCA